MNIVSLVLRIKPDSRADAEAALTAFPGVECHGMSEDGKLVVLPFEYERVIRGQRLEQNITLRSGDVVVVP